MSGSQAGVEVETRCLCCVQAQARVLESSQKLDLLRLALEKRLKDKKREPGDGVDASEGPVVAIRPASVTGMSTGHWI